MKILIINDFGYPEGGVETYLVNLRNLLEKRANIVKILTSDSHPELPHFNDYSFKSINPKSIFRVIPFLMNLYAYISLKRIIKNFKPDLVHLNYIFYHTSPSILLLLKNIPVVMTIHAHEILSPMGIDYDKCSHSEFEYCGTCCGYSRFPFEKLKRYLFRRLTNNIDLFLTQSRFNVSLHRNKKYIKPIKCLYNGVRLFEYSVNTNNNKLLFVGKLHQEKGILYLLRAIPNILKKFPNTTLDIIGTGIEKENLKNFTRKLSIELNVTFINRVNHAKLQKYYSNSSLVIVPSIYSESFGLVGVEAMSVGRPVIASRVGGISEWLDDGKTGFLVDPGNSEQIAEKVIHLLSDRKLLEQMGKNARKKAEQFSIEKHVIKIEKIYKELIEKYKTKEAS